MIRRAFTLIELLTVMAVTAILLTIIIIPIIQSFNLVRAGEAFADAQDQARILSDRISSEIGNAVSVRATNNLVVTTLNASAATLPNSSMVIQVPGLNNTLPYAFSVTGSTTAWVDVALPYTKVDILPPAQGQTPASIGSNGNYVDPTTGKTDPTLKAPTGQVSAPVLSSAAMVRYFVGLRNPAATYNDPYTGLLMAMAGGQDNLFVLYRSLVQPLVLMPASGGNSAKFVANTALFAADANNKPVLDDPRMFVLDRDPTTGVVLQNDHNVRVYHWSNLMSTISGSTQPANWAPWETPDGDNNTLADIEHNPANFARSVIETQISRYDMIAPQYNLADRKVTFDGNIPRITPCVQFRPTVISNDPTAGQEALRPGEETDNEAAIAPDVYKTQYGLWNNVIVRDYPPGYLQSEPTLSQYNEGYVGVSPVPGFSVFYFDPTLGSEFSNAADMETFDAYTYNLDLSNPAGAQAYQPFEDAFRAANSRSSFTTNIGAMAHFTPFTELSGPGKIVASFDISEIGANPLPVGITVNLPTVYDPDTYGPYTPSDDPNYTGGTWTGTTPWSPLPAPAGSPSILWTPTNLIANAYDINEAFNKAWDTYPDLQPTLQRFIDLRVLPNQDSTFGPLYPSYAGSTYALAGTTVTGFNVKQQNGTTLSRCRIVPGSDTVYGPDQNAGPNYGHPVRYTRTTRNPGPDQYRINYVDLPEPSDPTTGNVSSATYGSQLGLTSTELGAFDPQNYDPANFTSAMIQPRYKAGYIQLDSDPTVPVPYGYVQSGNTVAVPFQVDFRFQFTGIVPGSTVDSTTSQTYSQLGAGLSDIFAVEYDTRQLMQVLLTIRNYPQSNTPNPQSVTLKATAAIRNYAR